MVVEEQQFVGTTYRQITQGTGSRAIWDVLDHAYAIPEKNQAARYYCKYRFISGKFGMERMQKPGTTPANRERLLGIAIYREGNTTAKKQERHESLIATSSEQEKAHV
jgi:hypothetical protein